MSPSQCPIWMANVEVRRSRVWLKVRLGIRYCSVCDPMTMSIEVQFVSTNRGPVLISLRLGNLRTFKVAPVLAQVRRLLGCIQSLTLVFPSISAARATQVAPAKRGRSEDRGRLLSISAVGRFRRFLGHIARSLSAGLLSTICIACRR